MTGPIENPFLATETITEAAPTRAVAGTPSNGAAPRPYAASTRRLVIDEPPVLSASGAEPGWVASIPGLERPRPLAGRLRRLSADRRLAVGGVCAAVLIVVLLALSAMSGGGSDARLLAARRTISSLSDANQRLRAQARSLSASQQQVEGELQAARTQLQTLQARLAAVPARQPGHRKGGRT